MNQNTPSTSQAAGVGPSSSATGLKVGVGVGIPLGIAVVAGVAYLLWYKRHHEARLERLEKRVVTPQQLEGESSSCAGHEPLELPVLERPAMLGVPKDHLHELPTMEHSQEMGT